MAPPIKRKVVDLRHAYNLDMIEDEHREIYYRELDRVGLSERDLKHHAQELKTILKEGIFRKLTQYSPETGFALIRSRPKEGGRVNEIIYFEKYQEAVDYLAGFDDAVMALTLQFDEVFQSFVVSRNGTVPDRKGAFSLKPMHLVMGERYLVSTHPESYSAELVRSSSSSTHTIGLALHPGDAMSFYSADFPSKWSEEKRRR